MRLYYMTAKQWALVILREKRLKISTIPELNDPFELLGASIGERGMRRALEILHAHWTRELGMICMTDNWYSPVMWAHYADKHRGLCLGFDVSDQPGLISKVDYVPDRLQATLTLDKSLWGKDEALLVQILTTKHRDWSYEREYRVFAGLKDKDTNGLYYFDFGPQFVLREVILGVRCPLAARDLAREIKDLPEPVEVFAARPAFNSFQIIRDQEVEPIVVNPLHSAG